MIRTLALLAALLLSSLGAKAQDRHPWLSSPLRAEQPATYFTNLANGASIETPFVLKFGLTRYGLSPIDKPVPLTGHHHLLVNRDLPLDFTQPLPFNDQYIHFGNGQMETVLNFSPGTYTLRLLLANDKHIPYFIYSKPITITVTRRYDGIAPSSIVKPGVALLAPNAGDTVHPPFRVMFHASALNVGNAEIKTPGTGHFRLVAERPGARTEQIDFGNGATEAWLDPPLGDYSFHVEMVNNADGTLTAASTPIDVRVRAVTAD